MIIVLNGPFGVGKSTLAEALMESISGCAMLSGDALLAANPRPSDDVQFLHETLELLVGHYRLTGYRHFVIEHFWKSAAELADLRQRLTTPDHQAFCCFLLTLPAEENRNRVYRRQQASAIDDGGFGWQQLEQEVTLLAKTNGEIGEPFDASAPPGVLVRRIRERAGI